MPVSRAQKKSAAVKARLRRYRKAKQSDAGSDDDRPKSKTPATYKPSSSLYDEDTEDAEDYRPGGYHPLTIGETLDGRYMALKKLGWGQFSTVWLCQDLARIEGSGMVAIKIQKSSSSYTAAAADEAKILNKVSEAQRFAFRSTAVGSMPGLRDRFLLRGPNGLRESPNAARHKMAPTALSTDACMVFDVLGPSLLWLVRSLQHRGIPREDVRCIARDVLQGLVLLHNQCKMVHTDLKLENILLSHGVSPLDVPAEADDVLLKEGALLRGWALGSAEHAAQRDSVPALWMQLGATLQCNQEHSSDEDEAPAADSAAPTGAVEVHIPSAVSEQQPAFSLCLQLTAASISELESMHGSLASLPALPMSPASQCSEGEVPEAEPKPSHSAAPTCIGFSVGTSAGTSPTQHAAFLQRAIGPAHTIALRRTGPAPAASAAAAASDGSQPPPNSQLHEVTPWMLHVFDTSSILRILELIEGTCDHFLWVVHAAHAGDGVLKPSLRGLVCRKAAVLRVAADTLPHIPQSPLFGRRVKLGGGHQLAASACEAGNALVPRPLQQRCWLAGVPTGATASAAQEAATSAFVQATAAVTGFCSMWPAQHRLTCAVVDLGNACDVANPFSDDIQTRQYRAPEVLIRAGFDTAADMWSMGCIIFELITGDFLFNPRGGAGFTCDEDHLAQMVELMGEMPKALRRKGKDTKLFFTPAGKLKNIKKLKFWPLKLVLQDKYGVGEAEAACMADFLEGMLALQPEHRCSAQAALQHPWLQPHLSHDEAVAAFAASVAGGGAAASSGAVPSEAAAASAPAAHEETHDTTEVPPPGLPGQ